MAGQKAAAVVIFIQKARIRNFETVTSVFTAK